MTEVSDYRAILQELGFNRPIGGDPAAIAAFITYSFEAPERPLPPDLPYIETPDYAPMLTDEQKSQFREAFRIWGDACGIVFLEAEGDADILVGRRDLTVGGFGSTTTSGFFRQQTGQLVVTMVNTPQSMVVVDDTSMRTMLHEIGHALGLDHPHEGPFTLPSDLDNTNTTVMSYNVVGETGLGPLDIAAVQALFGNPDQDGASAESWSWDSPADTLSLVARPGSDILVSSGSRDVITAPDTRVIVTRGGDDFVRVGTNEFQMHAGPGTDTVAFDLARSELSSINPGGNYVSVQYASGGLGLMIDVERLQFTDGTLLLVLPTPEGEVPVSYAYAAAAYRIYAAAYGRRPDEAGLCFWSEVLDDRSDNYPLTHEDLKYLASFFLTANEFVDLYGANPTDEEYIAAMYDNVLHREMDIEGFEFWVDQMAAGQSWDDILAFFSESPENVAQTQSDVQNGFWVT